MQLKAKIARIEHKYVELENDLHRFILTTKSIQKVNTEHNIEEEKKRSIRERLFKS